MTMMKMQGVLCGDVGFVVGFEEQEDLLIHGL
jgi:hypothetical protein